MNRLLYLLLFTPLFLLSSCVEDVQGCLDSQACNFNSESTVETFCEYPDLGYDCDGVINEYVVGMEAEGGIIFYVDETGEHGLVTAIEDLPDYYKWACFGMDTVGYDGYIIGTGLQNSIDISIACPESQVAACIALAYETEGYSDWYLPSLDELLLMRSTFYIGGGLFDIGGFKNHFYWSSTINYNHYAWNVYFGGLNATSYSNVDTHLLVRPIRSF